MDGNIINAAYCGTSYITTRPAWLIDYGMVLKLSGIELPDVYEVDFANTKTETATRVLGGPDGVTIPDRYFLSPNAQQIFAWLYLHTGEDDGYTKIQVTIPLYKRPDVTDVPPTPEEQSIIEQAIVALNNGVERAETAAESAEEAVEHYPKIVDGFWHVFVDGEWQNTGVQAEGEDGAPGPQGPKGDKLTYADLTPADKADLIQGPIAEAQTAAVAAVNQEGMTQTGNVNAAGAAQVQAVEDKGEEVLESIPADYSDLSAEVDDLKSALKTYAPNNNNIVLSDAVKTDTTGRAWYQGDGLVQDTPNANNIKSVIALSDVEDGVQINYHAFTGSGARTQLMLATSGVIGATVVKYWTTISASIDIGNLDGDILTISKAKIAELYPTATHIFINIDKTSGNIKGVVYLADETTAESIQRKGDAIRKDTKHYIL